MKFLIIEDEKSAQRHLENMLSKLRPEWELIDKIDTVKRAIGLLESQSPQLIFCDIQLADGLSFEIFDHVKVNSPVIFTTAFDEYALKAFKTNSIDYLLKPIEIEELAAAIDKFENIYKVTAGTGPDEDIIKKVFKELQGNAKRNRYLIKVGEKLHSIHVDEVSYFYSENKSNLLKRKDSKEFIVDKTMDQIFEELNLERFFKINRSFILAIEEIQDIIQFSNSRLKVRMKDGREEIVARERVQDFKKWIDK